ncbi:uncharacterized protein SAPINGB_P005329 [Magnusiomyces paraingens]|uniref:L-lactate dehydrogenase (cytochrome) n=1 Tax=Magnusiomyces paraingens TaxID=2606893 RepID=A0A5E8C0E3_9ASCO|nr:uncharacterized protein SAPINGB_P005329 [Saprochaete ingens]VVT56842.1 unnamed protein product [Saprochaete ingens]
MPSYEEVAKHNSPESVWIIVHGKVYDVTAFLPEHPGGQKIILRYAGKDATAKFDTIHPKDIIDKLLPKEAYLGPVTGTPPTTQKSGNKQAESKQDENEEDDEDEDDDDDEDSEYEAIRSKYNDNKPPLNQMYNLFDFENVARRVMTRTGWGYYSSGADDEITLRENHRAFHRIWFRPKVLVDVTHVDPSTSLLGIKSSLPIYITATALGRLGHPDGEKVLTRAAAHENVIQMIPTLASCSFDEIVDARLKPDQPQWFQLYVNMDREITKKIVQHAEKRGIKGLFITVDAPQLGRREKDMRAKYVAQGANVQEEEDEEEEEEDTGSEITGSGIDRSQGYARAISSFIDPALSWKDLVWFRSITKMPILIKGVGRVEDAIRAAEAGIDGIVISNHGGRQLEFAKPAIEVLAEVMPALRARGLDKNFEVYIDGGIRRATDIVKAVCLGAKGVGIGRPFLYAMSSYGEKGVRRAIQLLRDEFEMNMRLLGVTSVDQLNETFLDIRDLSHHSAIPSDNLTQAVYEPMVPPSFKSKI